MEENKYQKELNLCVGRIKEQLSNVADINRLDNINVEIKSGDTPVNYDKKSEILYIDSQKLDNKGDRANEILKGLLDIISTDPITKKSGISMDGKMDAFNRGVTNQLANALIPTEEESLEDFECNVITNLFTHIAGRDDVFDSYFNSNGEKVYQNLLKKFGGDSNYLDTILSLSNTEIKSINEKQSSMLGYIESSISQKYIDNNTLTLEEMENFATNVLFKEPRFAPENGIARLSSCATADSYIREKINSERQIIREQALNDMIGGFSNNGIGEKYDSGRVGHK